MPAKCKELDRIEHAARGSIVALTIPEVLGDRQYRVASSHDKPLCELVPVFYANGIWERSSDRTRIHRNWSDTCKIIDPAYLFNTPGAHTMREFYDEAGLIPTSERADIALIRSHVHYHCGHIAAGDVEIKPGRGSSYRVNGCLRSDYIVKITDHYDHRDGVTGIV